MARSTYIYIETGTAAVGGVGARTP